MLKIKNEIQICAVSRFDILGLISTQFEKREITNSIILYFLSLLFILNRNYDEVFSFILPIKLKTAVKLV